MFKTFALAASLLTITATAASAPAASVYSTINDTAETVREIVLADLDDTADEETITTYAPEYKEEAASDDTAIAQGITVVPDEEETSSSYASSASKAHSVNTSSITAEMTGVYSYDFLQTLRSGDPVLYYDGDTANAEASLSEVISFYCSLKGGIDYYEVKDDTGYYLEIAESSWDKVQNAIATADAGWAAYEAAVESACYSLNLNTTDKDLVNQINNYICSTFDYEVTNSGMPLFISTKKGQCWHYAKMFADMCNSVGISAWKVENSEHAWVNVVVDGVTYKFDPTYNDTSGNWTKYSWLSV